MTAHPEEPREYADPIQAPGTDERRWQAWTGWKALPDFRLPASGRVVVVAAHPDDEVLGAGGAIALLRETGVEVTVVSVTDGERSHAAGGAVTPAELAGIRRLELRDALSHLGGADIVPLNVPDTEVAQHEDRVTAALSRVLDGARLCLAPWTGDLHSDHEAAGRAALAASRDRGVRCATYPVWMWHWAAPGDTRVPWPTAERVRLPAPVLERKRRAVGCFVSQTEPLGPRPEDAAILPPDELAHHLRPFEVVFT